MEFKGLQRNETRKGVRRGRASRSIGEVNRESLSISGNKNDMESVQQEKIQVRKTTVEIGMLRGTGRKTNKKKYHGEKKWVP